MKALHPETVSEKNKKSRAAWERSSVVGEGGIGEGGGLGDGGAQRRAELC